MKTEPYQQLPIEKVICREQVREQFDDNAINGLAQSLKSVGQLMPIRVYPDGDKFIVLDGERRLRGAIKAGMTTIASIIDDKALHASDVIERQLVANCQRVDLTPIEKARSIKRLMEAVGGNASDLASRLGLSPASVSRLLSLLTLPAPIIAEIESGRIAASTGAELAKISDPTKQASMAQSAVNGELTRNAVSDAVKRAKRPSSPSPGHIVKRASFSLGQRQSITVLSESLDFETFIAACETAAAKAKKARSQSLSFQTFLKVARDQAKS